MGVGRHAIADIYDCCKDKIDDIDYIKKIIFDSAECANLHIVDSKFHKFEPIGISGVLILSESHLTVHTWPEYNYLAVDVFTCGNRIDPKKACEIIAKKFQSKKYEIKEIERGKNCEVSRIRD